MTWITVQKSNNAYKALLKAKQIVKISSLNTRTFSDISQRGELTASASFRQYDIVCVQQHRFYHDEVMFINHATRSKRLYIYYIFFHNFV